VSYQLNGGAWATAQTANGWSNWTAGVTLTPGTNRVSAYAVDAAGNKSDTKTVSFTYVVTSPLVVQTIGAGTLSPNYSGQALEIGKTYSLSAKAAKGFTFRGWTGGVTSPLAKLTFVMQPGLTLTANFADTTKPTLKVLSPKTKAKLTGVLVTVTGTAADNGPLSAVNCQLNGGAWITANGTTSWQTGLHLVSGANTIKVYAVDAAGNMSTTNTLIVTCTATGARAASEWAAADAPVLSIRREGNEILLSWPAEVAGYSIESTETLDESAIWTPITNPPEVVEGQNTVTDNLGDKPKFYRLRK
jgi:hypothetical protein